MSTATVTPIATATPTVALDITPADVNDRINSALATQRSMYTSRVLAALLFVFAVALVLGVKLLVRDGAHDGPLMIMLAGVFGIATTLTLLGSENQRRNRK